MSTEVTAVKSLFLKQKTEVPLLGAPVVTPQNSLSRNDPRLAETPPCRFNLEKSMAA